MTINLLTIVTVDRVNNSGFKNKNVTLNIYNSLY